MRIVLIVIAIALIGLGMWMITSDFLPDEAVATAGSQITNVEQPTGSPIILGVILLAGGVIFLVMVQQRR